MANRNQTKELSVFGSEYTPIRLGDEFGRMAGMLWDTWAPEFFEMPSIPSFELTEGDSELVLKTEVPGIKREDVDVVIDGRLLTVTAEKKQGKGKKEQTTERHVRSILLPYNVAHDKVSADLAKGILEIRVVKPEDAKTHKIEITAHEPAVTEKKVRKPVSKN